MTRVVLPAALLLLLLGLPGAAQQAPFGRVTTVDLPRAQKAEQVLLEDVDGDGQRDLVVMAARGGRRDRRTLRVHFRQAGDVAFAPEPDHVFDLLPDVVGIAVADVHADRGAEIVLLAPTGAFALRPSVEGERERYVQLAAAEVLWQLPLRRSVVVWQDGIRDLNGDGLVDLLLPEPDGYTVALQSRAAGGPATFAVHTLRLPDGGSAAPRGDGARRQDGRAGRRRMEVNLRLGESDSEQGSGALLSVSESVPAPRVVDWDGDGRLDILAQTVESLLVWRQAADATFPVAPTVVVELPLQVDRRRLLDVSYAAHAADLDGDGRADYVLVAGDPDSDDPRAQIAVYRRARDESDGVRPLFGAKGLPAQLLIVAGIAGAPGVQDVDGDGLPDLVVGSARIDALDAVRAAAGGSLDVDLYVYRNRGGTFSKRPDLTRTLSVGARGLREARGSLAAEFIGDVTGDGVSELLLRDDPTRVQLLMVRRVGADGLTVVDRPLWATTVDADAELVVAGGDGTPPECVLFTKGSLLHVRFGK